MDESQTDKDWLELELDVARLFSAAPLRSPDNGSKEELYAGRSSEAHRLMEAVRDPAKHILLYGERGVGKTSISNTFWTKYDKFDRPIIVVRVQAYPSDDFSSLWLKVLEELEIVGKQYCNELRADFTSVSPDILRREFQKLRTNLVPIIIIDEFDQLRAEEARELTANLLKYLHDDGINVTIILIGVADNVEELISNHQSLRRVLSLVKIERMSALDLNEILDRRLRLTPLSLAGDARSAIVGLSCGLPYFVQTLGKFAAQNAIRNQRTSVRLDDVNVAIEKFIVESGESFGEAYQRATQSMQAGNIFEEVILACALTPSDKSGFFKPFEVAKVLNLMTTEKNRTPSQVQQYLSLFASEKRGRVLLRHGMETEYRYRFSDATMQPFIIMRAIKDRLIDGGFQFLLFHWYLEEIRDGGYQLGIAGENVTRDVALDREKNGPRNISIDVAEQPIEAITVQGATENASDEASVPSTPASERPRGPTRKSFFYRFFS